VPVHSTFLKNQHGRFRERDLFHHLSGAMVLRCLEEGLVGGEGFAVDASLLHADANERRSVPESDWQVKEPIQDAPGLYVSISLRSTKTSGVRPQS